jgi:outer membrane protein assembly factor BamA
LLAAATASADPAPGDESGIVHNDETETSVGTDIARGALFVPKVVVQVIGWPIGGIVWIYDRWEINDLYYRIFYNREHTFGIVPSITYATGLGFTGGFRLISKNTFGDHEYLTLLGTYGGTYHTRNEAWLDSGWRLHPVVVRLGGNFERFDPLPFYGVGDLDNAAKSQYRYQELRAELSANWRMFDHVHLIGRGAYAQIKTSNPSSGTSIGDLYMGTTGFDTKFSHLYGELEVRWDERHNALPWETTTYSRGWLLRGFAGRVHELDQGPDFTHYAVDAQYFLRMTLAPRMFVFRFWGEGVTADRTDVPFTELPYLGGDFLRGYDYARFRDKVAAVATAQYQWDLSRFADAFIFVDAGRVYPALTSLSLDNMRVGYGGGLNLHSNSGDYVAGVTVASSIDGGLQFTLTLAPLWNGTPRWR